MSSHNYDHQRMTGMINGTCSGCGKPILLPIGFYGCAWCDDCQKLQDHPGWVLEDDTRLPW